MRSRILFIILVIVILLAVYTFFVRQKIARPVVASSIAKSKSAVKEKTQNVKKSLTEVEKTITQTVSAQPATILNNQVSTLPEQDTVKILKWGSDPFVRPWILSSEIKDLKLKAITISGKKAYALINDQILETGEMIAGKSITAIEKDKVILEQGGRTFTLLLGE